MAEAVGDCYSTKISTTVLGTIRLIELRCRQGELENDLDPTMDQAPATLVVESDDRPATKSNGTSVDEGRWSEECRKRP